MKKLMIVERIIGSASPEIIYIGEPRQVTKQLLGEYSDGIYKLTTLRLTSEQELTICHGTYKSLEEIFTDKHFDNCFGKGYATLNLDSRILKAILELIQD